MSLRSAAALIPVLFLLPSACKGPAPPAATLSSGIDLAGMDKTVNPGDDFYEYANGTWLKSTPIPPDKSRYGVTTILADQTLKQLQALLQETAGAGTGARATPEVQKVGDFYSTYMDEARIESKGITPLKPQLDAIAGIQNRNALSGVIGGSLRADVDALNATNFYTENLFGVWITLNLMDPTRTVPYLLQGGLGMPDRDYYISKTPQMEKLRTQYRMHIAAMLMLAGMTDPAMRAARVFALETKMAGVHATRVQSEDVHSARMWKREEFAAKAPGLDWAAVFDAAGLKDAPEFIVWHPKAVTGLSALTASEPLDAWKDWLAYHAIEHSGPFLPKAFVDERFNFFGKALNGTPEQRPRWQRGLDLTNDALGDAVGKIYVQRYFPPEAKAKIQALVDELVKAFNKRIDALSWMSAETKVKAKQKVATLKVGVGYPDHWEDYSGLEIIKGDAFGNAQRAELFHYRRQREKLHQPIDRGEWWMTPQTVNAVNLPIQNALNFPAAFLQPPFFDPNADAAHNYGAVGAVIGHEISHSFDDQGSQFDAEGRLSNWWTKEDFDHFKAAGEALAAQYDQYRPFPDLAVNGHQTLSENIADLAGLAAAYDAYQLSLNGKPAPVLDGFTGDQRFFLSFAQSWREKEREAALRNIILTDGHAPEQYRAYTVRNLDPWYVALSVMSNAKMYLGPANPVRVW